MSKVSRAPVLAARLLGALAVDAMLMDNSDLYVVLQGPQGAGEAFEV
jgi:hypothetical protein